MRHILAAFFAITGVLLITYASLSDSGTTRVQLKVDWLKLEFNYERKEQKEHELF